MATELEAQPAPETAGLPKWTPRPASETSGFQLLAPAALQPRVDCWQSTARYGADKPIEHYLQRDSYPLPDISDREGYHGERHYAFWVSGLCDYMEMKRAMARHQSPLGPNDHVLDLGCASGRTMRHFACQEDGLTIWGVDIKKRNVEWCTRFLPPNIRPVLGTDVPNLPIADGSLALAYAFSVFTHIDDFETAWLAELHRVLRPGGVAYLTIHSERLWTRMNSKHPIYNALVAMKGHKEFPIDPEQFTRPMPADRVVFRMGHALHHVNVFHSDEYLRKVWARFFHIAEIIETPDRVQAEVVLIKK